MKKIIKKSIAMMSVIILCGLSVVQAKGINSYNNNQVIVSEETTTIDGYDITVTVYEDMNEKIKQLADTLNSTHGGKYLFGGSSVDDAPITVIENPDGTVKLEFSKDKNGQTIPNTDDLKADISSGINIDYNISVGEILNIKDGNGNTVNLLDEINNLSTLMNDIANGDEQTAAKAKETLLNDTKGKIDTLFDHVVNERTSLGVRVSTAEKIKELNDEDILNIQDVLSKTQDTDVVEKFIELKSAEMIYQASIQVGAKLIQPTILDYIR